MNDINTVNNGAKITIQQTNIELLSKGFKQTKWSLGIVASFWSQHSYRLQDKSSAPTFRHDADVPVPFCSWRTTEVSQTLIRKESGSFLPHRRRAKIDSMAAMNQTEIPLWSCTATSSNPGVQLVDSFAKSFQTRDSHQSHLDHTGKSFTLTDGSLPDWRPRKHAQYWLPSHIIAFSYSRIMISRRKRSHKSMEYDSAACISRFSFFCFRNGRGSHLPEPSM